jgi:hypothetical protein
MHSRRGLAAVIILVGCLVAFGLERHGGAGASEAEKAPIYQELPGENDLNCGSDGVTSPRLIPESKTMPKYPKQAKKEHLEARLICTALIKKTGAVGSLVVLGRTLTFEDGKTEQTHGPILSPDAYGFDAAAKAAVLKWRYEPCFKDGNPVDGWYTVVVDFVLSSSPKKTSEPTPARRDNPGRAPAQAIEAR